ncbi:MAG: TraB/GumN family protein [Desulfobacterales bacterium]
MGDHTTFLIGSIHLMPKNMHPLPDKFEKAFSLSPIIVIETNPDDVTSHEVRQYVRSVGFYPHGETIWKNISAKMQKKLMQKLSEKQFPVHMAEKIRPWLLSTMLEDKEEEDSDSKMHHALGIDMYFFRKALQEGKTLMFLETAQDQIDCTAKLPPAQQEFLLKDALEKKLAKGEIPLHKVLELWKKGDADTLEFHYRNHHKKHMEIYRSVMVDIGE